MPDHAYSAAFPFRGRGAGAAFLWSSTVLFAALVITGTVSAARTGSLLPLLLVPVFLAAAALVGAMAARLPAAGVRPSSAGLSIRFPIALDRTIPWSDVASAELARHPLWHGLGIRLTPGGSVALATLPGPCAEVAFRAPQQVTVLPGVARVQAHRLRLTVESPADLVAAIQSRLEPVRRS